MFVIQQTLFAADPVKKVYPAVGDPVPAFTFESEKGKTVSIGDYNNQTMLLVFFATWCPPCRAELPHIQKEIWEKYGSNSRFKLLAFGREHTRREIDKFVAETHFTFPIVSDPKREVFSLFAPQEIPRSYLIVNGKIVKMTVGFTEEEFNEMVKLIDSSLNTDQK
ncbi:MAG TPA: TlpA disulfide reductase family protein [Prolixibacteraceae bacterium]|nr:TlpA disulfide reductase family protein [Prolixibacteraceae bacterium]